jgi:hypothetical protein
MAWLGHFFSTLGLPVASIAFTRAGLGGRLALARYVRVQVAGRTT